MSKTSLKRVGWLEEKPLHFHLPVLYNAMLGEFSVVFAGTTYRDTNQKTLESRVREAIRESMRVVWVPVIELRPSTGISGIGVMHAPQFGFAANRKHVAQLPQGAGFKHVGWIVSERERLTASTLLGWDMERDGPFAPPCTMRGPGVPRLFCRTRMRCGSDWKRSSSRSLNFSAASSRCWQHAKAWNDW